MLFSDDVPYFAVYSYVQSYKMFCFLSFILSIVYRAFNASMVCGTNQNDISIQWSNWYLFMLLQHPIIYFTFCYYSQMASYQPQNRNEKQNIQNETWKILFLLINSQLQSQTLQLTFYSFVCLFFFCNCMNISMGKLSSTTKNDKQTNKLFIVEISLILYVYAAHGIVIIL